MKAAKNPMTVISPAKSWALSNAEGHHRGDDAAGHSGVISNGSSEKQRRTAYGAPKTRRQPFRHHCRVVLSFDVSFFRLVFAYYSANWLLAAVAEDCEIDGSARLCRGDFVPQRITVDDRIPVNGGDHV